MKKLLIVCCVLGLLACAGIWGFKTFLPEHESISQKSVTYTLDHDFEKVKKILVRTDSLEEVVAHQHGKVLSRQWNNLNISSQQLLKNWEVDGTAQFSVEADHPDTGKIVLDFHQKVFVGSTRISVVATMIKPVGFLETYRTTLEFEPDGLRTKVISTVSLSYKRRLPRRYIPYMDGQVSAAADRGLTRGEEAIRQLIDKYKDKRFIFPVK